MEIGSLSRSLSPRRKIAAEAANLLYTRVEKEYKQAKLAAAKTLGGSFLPTNLEVALELDRISEENEGSTRKEQLVQMRHEALKLMRILKAYDPLLIGSVWRGTVRHGSDIDITTYHSDPNDVLKTLGKNKIEALRTEWTAVTKHGKRKASFHIYLELPGKERAEIVVRNPEEAQHMEECEIFGDRIKGLHSDELEKLLKENPTQRFLPS